MRFGRAIGEALMAVRAAGRLRGQQRPQPPAASPGRRPATTPGPPQFDQAVADTFARRRLGGSPVDRPGLVAAAGECGYRSLAVLSGVVAAVRGRGRRDPQPPALVRRPVGRGLPGGRGGDAGRPAPAADEGGDPMSQESQRRTAIRWSLWPARPSRAYVRDRKVLDPEPLPGLEPRRAGVFVSLHLPDGSLRGCIGTTAAHRSQPSRRRSSRNAISAATRDPRFYPLEPRRAGGSGHLGGRAGRSPRR